MTDRPADNGDYGLVMPFPTCQSNGGPHDDVAYTCGWEMGMLDTCLGLMSSFIGVGPLGTVQLARYIHADNQKQADLIAMKHGYTARFEPWTAGSGWVWMELRRA